MSYSNRPSLSTSLVLVLLALGLSACATSNPFGSFSSPQPPAAPQPAAVPLLPPAFPPQDIVGRWGLAAYHRDEDRPRIEAAAVNQCKQPYTITLGPTGGVMMHLADQAKPEELSLKGAPGRQDLYRPGVRSAGQRTGSRGSVVRRPHTHPALDGSGSAGPLRHHGLCALRAGRRQTPGQTEAQAESEAKAESRTQADPAADPERPATAAAGAVTSRTSLPGPARA